MFFERLVRVPTEFSNKSNIKKRKNHSVQVIVLCTPIIPSPRPSRIIYNYYLFNTIKAIYLKRYGYYTLIMHYPEFKLASNKYPLQNIIILKL
jgi:hypothetical protein